MRRIAVKDGNIRQRSLRSPTIASPQFERHSAPSRVGRSHLPSPSDVIQPPTASSPVRRTSNSGAGIPRVVSPITIRRTAESSPKVASRTDFGLARRTNKARPTVDSPSAHGEQEQSPVHARNHADEARLPDNELPEDGFTVHDLSDCITDNRCRYVRC